MPIVSSQIIAQSAQKTGVLITEAHTDDLGATYKIEHLADVGANTAAVLSEHATWLNGELAAIEAAKLINGA